MSEARSRELVWQGVAEALALEQRVEQTLDRHLRAVREPREAAEVLQRLYTTAKTHCEALQAYADRLGGGMPAQSEGAGAPAAAPAVTAAGEGTRLASAALREDYTLCSQAAIGYAALHQMARIAFDLGLAEIAERHLHGYAAAAQEINQVIADVVAWELRRQGLRCQCQCPSCIVGVCLCVANTNWIVNRCWQETAPAVTGRGLRVVRTASAPAELELRDGDVVRAVEGQEVATTADTLTAIRGRTPGEPVRFTVLRDGSTVELIVTRTKSPLE
jgi:hypothetical protein